MLVIMMTALLSLSACQKEVESEESLPVNDAIEEDVKFDFDKVIEEPGEKSVKSFDMMAKKWEFVPSTIIVNKGDTVKLSIASADVTHGFALREFGVSANLVAGKIVEIEFIASKKGTFDFFCSVFCGSGHGSMKGTLVVE